MILTDTHTHLYSTEFKEDLNEVIKRAFDAGVQRFFLPAIDSTFVPDMYRLEERYPDHIYLMAGLHPTHVGENFKEELNLVQKQLNERSFVAIGEIGMDLYWDKTFKKQQQEAFQQQIRLAKKHKLPIVIHCREAFDEIFEILETEKGDDLKGIFHCFTGNLEEANRAISYNMKLGIGGVVTFKNGKIDKFLNQVPLEEIVLETDSPYLAPVPYRGKRNESSYLTEILKKVSELYNLRPEQVAAVTTQTSKDIFGI